MIKKPHLIIVPTCGFIFIPSGNAAFFEDGSANIEVKNFFFNRDFRGNTAAQSKREEWAQGFTLKMQSGFTEGPIGFGVDGIAMLGLKLDSSQERTGTGLLPKGGDGRAEDSYAKADLTAKVKYESSLLYVGALMPVLPLIASNNSRLFPQIFQGVQITSRDLKSATFTLGQVDKVKQRDSSNYDHLTVMGQMGAYDTNITADRFTYAGIDFQSLKDLTISYHVSELEDVFRRNYVGLKFNTTIGPGKAMAELRYFDAREAGRSLVGEVDNRTLSSNFGYSAGPHTLSGGYQKGSGETAYMFLGGTDSYLFSEMQVSTFALANERVWHMRYDYNFSAIGIPGLTFNVRYVKGDDVDPAHIRTKKSENLRVNRGSGREWERATDLTYVVQDGPLRNLSLRWRYASNRSNYADSADETRFTITYPLEL